MRSSSLQILPQFGARSHTEAKEETEGWPLEIQTAARC